MSILRFPLRIGSVAAAIALTLGVSLSAGCDQPKAAPADVCEAATQQLSVCGVSLPLAASSGCTGARKVISQCIADHADGCDQLATLLQRIDSCVADLEADGGDAIPEGVALDARDASADGHSPFSDGGDSDALASDANTEPDPFDANTGAPGNESTNPDASITDVDAASSPSPEFP